MIVVKSMLLFVLTAVICSSSVQGLHYSKDKEFNEWVSQYYGDGDDLAEIYSTWRKNADFVKEHNSLGLSYTVAVNQFTHLNVNELIWKQTKKVNKFEPTAIVPSTEIPTSIDWRDKDVVPPVVEQGECGDSTLFTILDSIDAFWAINHNKDKNHLVMASRNEATDCCFSSGGCNGGPWNLTLYQCIANLGGLASASEYNSPNHTCLSDKFPPVVKINGGKYVLPQSDERALTEAVARQPIAVAVDASHQSFQLYRSGVYYDPECSSEKLDHAMLVVGYGSTNGEDYWIAKNSWGESWGMNGYILMARNKGNNCGIASEAMYPY